jgi:hypothetical protein
MTMELKKIVENEGGMKTPFHYYVVECHTCLLSDCSFSFVLKLYSHLVLHIGTHITSEWNDALPMPQIPFYLSPKRRSNDCKNGLPR